MEDIKIDRRKLKTYKNYAQEQGCTVQNVYQLVKAKKLPTTEIDGVKFILV